jgi:hypothetical protein
MIYWWPKPRKHSWNAVTFLENLASACPLEVEPAAERLIRVLLAWRPVAGPEALVLEGAGAAGASRCEGAARADGGGVVEW